MGRGVYADDVPKMVQEIVGSCAKCELYKPYGDGNDEYGHCLRSRDSLEAYWVKIEVDDNWYCVDFKRRV